MCITLKCDRIKKIKFHEHKTVRIIHVMHSTVQRINSYLGEWDWIFPLFVAKTFETICQRGVRAFNWMEIIKSKFKLAEDGTRFPDILIMYVCLGKSSKKTYIMVRLAVRGGEVSPPVRACKEMGKIWPAKKGLKQCFGPKNTCQ